MNILSDSAVTLNIETDSVRFLTTRGREVEDWGSMPLAPGLVKDGLILEPATVSSIIDELFRSKKLPRNKIIASLSGWRSIFRILSLPKMKRNLINEAIRREAKREFPVPLEELYLTWQALSSRYSEQQFFVLGVPRNLLDAEVQTFRQSGIKPYIMELKPLALARVVNERQAIVINLGSGGNDIIIIVNSMPAIMRTIILRSEAGSPEDRIERLVQEISRTVRFYNNSHRENPLEATTPLFITGELVADAAIAELVQEGVDYPIKPLTPVLKCPADLPLPQYAVNVGLALKQISQGVSSKADSAHSSVINLNVLPDNRDKPHWRPRITLGLFRRRRPDPSSE
jgi:type IV pilus assembly protein PilM